MNIKIPIKEFENPICHKCQTRIESGFIQVSEYCFQRFEKCKCAASNVCDYSYPTNIE